MRFPKEHFVEGAVSVVQAKPSAVFGSIVPYQRQTARTSRKIFQHLHHTAAGRRLKVKDFSAAVNLAKQQAFLWRPCLGIPNEYAKHFNHMNRQIYPDGRCRESPNLVLLVCRYLCFGGDE